MKLKICQQSYWNWRKHMGPKKSHPYLASFPESEKKSTKKDAMAALALISGVIGMTGGFRF